MTVPMRILVMIVQLVEVVKVVVAPAAVWVARALDVVLSEGVRRGEVPVA